MTRGARRPGHGTATGPEGDPESRLERDREAAPEGGPVALASRPLERAAGRPRLEEPVLPVEMKPIEEAERQARAHVEPQRRVGQAVIPRRARWILARVVEEPVRPQREVR